MRKFFINKSRFTTWDGSIVNTYYPWHKAVTSSCNDLLNISWLLNIFFKKFKFLYLYLNQVSVRLKIKYGSCVNAASISSFVDLVKVFCYIIQSPQAYRQFFILLFASTLFKSYIDAFKQNDSIAEDPAKLLFLAHY